MARCTKEEPNLDSYQNHTTNLQHDSASAAEAPGAVDLRIAFRDCTVTLQPQFIPGGSLWARQIGKAAHFLAVATNLPDPRTFGPDLTIYWYIIQDVFAGRMSREEGPFNTWIGEHEGTDVVVPFPPQAFVNIVAGTPEAPAEVLPVLTSNLRFCH